MANSANYKQLIVYKKAEKLTIESYKLFAKYDFDYGNRYGTIINQYLRAISSVGANIAEGYGRHYKKSYRHFLSIARGSTFEAEYWLEIMLKLKVCNQQDTKIIKEIQNDNIEIIKMLTSLMKRLE